MQTSNAESAKSILAWLLRRRWGMTALREAARLKLNCFEFVGRGAAAASDRRIDASGAIAARVRRAACHFWQGLRLPSAGRGDAF